MFIITYRKLFLSIGLAIVVVCGLMMATFGLKLGLDFTGGSLTEVKYAAAPDKAAIEQVLQDLALSGSSVRESDGELGRSFIVTTKNLELTEQKALEEKLVALKEGGSIVRTTSVGPVMGEELRSKAYYAIAMVLAITIIYVAFAFRGIGTPVSSWVYGAFTVIVLAHDILVPAALMSFLGHYFNYEIDVLFVTVLLTILGYSVNDTIVIFDRVREKIVQNRTEKRTKHEEPGGIVREEVVYTLTKPFDELVGEAVRDTMGRSINTVLTVLIALTALYFFGSSVTKTFALVLIAGVTAGAYSSIFIASPMLVAYEEWTRKKSVKVSSK